MVGNRAGWIIAAGIVALECGGIYYALSFDRHSGPTPLTNPASLAAMTLPPFSAIVTPAANTENATQLYHAAILDYQKNIGAYESAIRNRNRTGFAKLDGIEKLLAARAGTGDSVFAEHIADILDYGEPDALLAITQVGKATYLAGTLYTKPEDRARALEYYYASFTLGRRLANEKLTWREYDAGVGLMSESGSAMVATLGKSPENAAIVESLQKSLDEMREQRKQAINIFEAIYSNNESKIATHAGDVFAFARESGEPMWRVEAILKLGRLKYNIGNPPVVGNQRYASRLLRELSTSSDPIIRQAAERARALTAEQFRTLR